MEKTLHIEGMSCQHCARAVKSALESVPGVASARVDLERGLATVEAGPAVDEAALVAAVADEGYEARPG